MAIAESSTVAVSYVGVGAGGGEQSPPISLQNETNATPTAPNTPGGDPGLTVLQPPVSQPQVASAIPPYSTMLPSFGHYATGEYTEHGPATSCPPIYPSTLPTIKEKKKKERTEGKLGLALQCPNLPAPAVSNHDRADKWRAWWLPTCSLGTFLVYESTNEYEMQMELAGNVDLTYRTIRVGNNEFPFLYRYQFSKLLMANVEYVSCILFRWW